MTHSPTGSPPPAPSVAQTRAAILDVARMISEARSKMVAGEMVTLADLEHRCRLACQMATRLPPPLGRQVRNDLEAVLYDLDALETDMTQRFGALARRPLADDSPRPLTVGAAYQAGLGRTARPRSAAPQPVDGTASYPPSAAPPASDPTEPHTAPTSPRRSWTL